VGREHKGLVGRAERSHCVLVQQQQGAQVLELDLGTQCALLSEAGNPWVSRPRVAWLLDSAQCTHSPFLTACPPHANCSVDMSYRPPQSASSTKRGLFGTNGDVDSAGCRTALFATIPFDAIRVCYYTIRRHTLTQAHASTRKHMQSTCLLESLTHMSTYTNSRTHTQMT